MACNPFELASRPTVCARVRARCADRYRLSDYRSWMLFSRVTENHSDRKPVRKRPIVETTSPRKQERSSEFRTYQPAKTRVTSILGHSSHKCVESTHDQPQPCKRKSACPRLDEVPVLNCRKSACPRLEGRADSPLSLTVLSP